MLKILFLFHTNEKKNVLCADYSGYANSNDVFPIYIGDDRTDEDAFKVSFGFITCSLRLLTIKYFHFSRLFIYIDELICHAQYI